LLYTATEASEYLGISRSTLRRWLSQGRLTASKDTVTGQFSFDQAALDKLRKVAPMRRDKPNVNESNVLEPNVLEQLALLSDAVREIQAKQDELLCLLRTGSHLSSENRATLSPKSAGNGITVVKNKNTLSSQEYTQTLFQRYEAGDSAGALREVLGHLLDRQAIAAELDKAWKMGDNSKQDWLKSLLHHLTLEATGA
jgi:excisionase family DNA binding protein